jgi:ankyrin repeat protein
MDIPSVFTAPESFAAAVRDWLNSGGDPNVVHPVSGGGLLHGAAEYQDLATIERLLDAGADVNARDSYGRTPLHISVDSELDTQGRKDPPEPLPVTRKLLQRGADPTLRDNDGRTPADWARGYGEETGEWFRQAFLRASDARRGSAGHQQIV